jgi:hypothetical protein
VEEIHILVGIVGLRKDEYISRAVHDLNECVDAIMYKAAFPFPYLY